MNLCDINTVKRLMSKYDTGTKKGFGQNFLINEEVPYNIANESYNYHAAKDKAGKRAVIEIGPGIGSLTSELCRLYDKVIAVEIDKTLIPILGETLAFLPKTTIIGAIINYLTSAEPKGFQPMNANFGILPELDDKIRDKKLKKQAYSNRAIVDIKKYKEKYNVTV